MLGAVNKLDHKTVPTDAWPREGFLRLVLISDTHMQHRKLVMPKGDVLIHAGDFTNKGRVKDINEFDSWLGELDYAHKIVVFGNHDTETDSLAIRRDGRVAEETTLENGIVLKNDTIVIEGLTVFGSPYTLDPFKIDWWAHKADFEEEMEQYMNHMQEGVDIVVTHSPPYGIGDKGMDGTNCGSRAMRAKIDVVNPALHVFGHIHEGRGWYMNKEDQQSSTLFVNASSLASPLKSSLSSPFVLDVDLRTKSIHI